MEILDKVNPKELVNEVEQAVRSKKVDIKQDRSILKKIEVLLRDLHHYMRSFEYSVPSRTGTP